MKTYEETTEAVLDRIGKYKAEQKRRRKIALGTVTPLCCLFLVGAVAFGIWNENKPVITPEQTLEDALYPGIKDTFDVSKGEDPDDPAANNKIIINPIDGVSADRMNIALMCDDFVAMSQDEINAYYGVDILPELPADLKPWENGGVGIFRRDNGTGEIYYDQNTYNFSNEDITRSVCMTVAKGRLPFFCFVIDTEDFDESVINNHEIVIAQADDGSFHTEFMYQNAGFYISSYGITEEELVSVIASIIK